MAPIQMKSPPKVLLTFPFSDEEWKEIKARIETNATPLWQYWEEFVTRYCRLGRSLSTIRNIRETITHLLRNTNITSIELANNARLVEDELFQLREKRGFSSVTFNTYVKNLKTYFLWLARNKYISENNLSSVQKCSEIAVEQLVLNEDQVSQVLKLALKRRQTRLQRLRNLCFLCLLCFTGARPCELANIKMEDIRADKNGTYRLRIQGAKQNTRPRYYLLDSWVRDAYLNYVEFKAQVRPNEPYLLISSSKKKPWGKKGIAYLMKKLSSEAGFRINSYSFRRYVATRLYGEHLPIDQIADYLGHVDSKTTKTYIESSCARTIEASEILKKII